MKPTLEQQSIMEATESIVKVKAAAGSGKTSTITLFSNINEVPSIYLAFNKSIASEVQGKLGNHVESKTTHSLAYKKFGGSIRSKLNRPRGRYVNVAGTPSEIAKYYKIQPIMFRNEPVCSATAMGLLIKKTTDNFQASADTELSTKHVTNFHRRNINSLGLGAEDFEMLDKSIKSKVLMFSKTLWEDRSTPSSKVLANHDTYLKMYQLSKPKLNYDIIYLDEAQDTTDCVIDIVMNQANHAKIVLVGDDFQAIYGWRGAVNAMSKINTKEYKLTKSFRFGDSIANTARRIIDNQMDITGNSDIKSIVGKQTVDRSNRYTKIYRTNSGLLLDAIELTRSGASVSAEVDSKDFIKILDSALALYTKASPSKIKHDLIIPYQKWYDLVEESHHAPELKRVVKIVEGGEVANVISALKLLQKSNTADIILTTAHKSKGREWDQVVLASDFPDIGEEGLPQEEINLLYVAATRAINKLETNESVDTLLDMCP